MPRLGKFLQQRNATVPHNRELILIPERQKLISEGATKTLLALNLTLLEYCLDILFPTGLETMNRLPLQNCWTEILPWTQWSLMCALLAADTEALLLKWMHATTRWYAKFIRTLALSKNKSPISFSEILSCTCAICPFTICHTCYIATPRLQIKKPTWIVSEKEETDFQEHIAV